MKTLTINIPDDIYSELHQAVFVRKLAGMYDGMADAFLFRLLYLLENNVSEHTFAKPPKKDTQEKG